MARAPALFFRLELADAIVYKFTTAFVDFNFTFLFIDYLSICDDGSCNISVFTTDGVYVTSFGQYGSNEGGFNYPNSVCVDQDGFVYVTDKLNNRVQCF